MKIRHIPYNIIVTIVAITGIVLVLVSSRHTAPQNAVPQKPTGQATDSSIGLYTDIITNKNAVTNKPVMAGVVPNACTLSLSISAGTSTADGKAYAITVRNTGKTACTSASLSLYYGDGETYKNADLAPTSSGYYWNFNTLGGVTTKTIALTTSISSSGTPTLEGCLSAANGSDACTTAGAAAVPHPTPIAKTKTAISTLVSGNDKKIPITSGQEAGVWEWNDVTTMSDADMNTIAQQAAANGFTAIYLTIDGYADTATYTATLESFVRTAQHYGLAVDAEAGWRDWGEATQRQKAIDILSYVQQFNAAQPAKIRGVQYDIESYLLPQYDDDKTTILTNYVGLVDMLEKQAGSTGIPLTMVLPHFYDAAQQWTPSIAYNGTTNFTFNQVLTLLNRHAGNRIIIMAYRNTADGTDGAIALAQKELSDASGSHTKIIVAQETGAVDPAYVTFANTSRSALFKQLAAINAAFGSTAAYGGIAIDYLDPFLNLK